MTKEENIFIKICKAVEDILYEISLTFLVCLLFIPAYIVMYAMGKVDMPLENFLNEIIEGYRSK